jgi:hypothetical protein
MQPIPAGATRERRKRDDADGATPIAAPCCAQESLPVAHLPWLPSVVAHLWRARPQSHCVCDACTSVCARIVRERGHAFDHQYRVHPDELRSLLRILTTMDAKTNVSSKTAGLLIRERPHARSIDEAHMGGPQRTVDGGCRACERPASTQPCVLWLCKACKKQLKAAHHQRSSSHSVDVHGSRPWILPRGQHARAVCDTLGITMSADTGTGAADDQAAPNDRQ